MLYQIHLSNKQELFEKRLDNFSKIHGIVELCATFSSGYARTTDVYHGLPVDFVVLQIIFYGKYTRYFLGKF